VTFDAAFSTAASEIGGDVARSMMRRLRTFRHDVDDQDDDHPIARLMALARRSEMSGSGLADELRVLAETEYAIDAAATAERLARLPVTMLFPLALLILPGFILVAVAPPLISGITRIGL
jgi:pilus assembly protein TadC